MSGCTSEEPNEHEWLVLASDVPDAIEVSCPICKIDYSEQRRPQALDCGHSVCAQCGTGLVDADDGRVRCSLCKCPTAALADNLALLSLLKVVASEVAGVSPSVIEFQVVPSAELLVQLGAPMRLSLPSDISLEALHAHVQAQLPEAVRSSMRPCLRDASTHKFLRATTSATYSVQVGAFDNLDASPPVIGIHTPWVKFFHLYRKRLLTPEQLQAQTRVTCHDNRVCFGTTGFSVDFQRTLRLPMDGKVHPLPPGLGKFPIVPVDAYKSKVPAAWRERGGVIVPLQEAESLWLNFGSAGYGREVAVQVATGDVNAVSGQVGADAARLQKSPQNYLVSPPQQWLDGFNAGKGVVKQFVAASLGSHVTVEAQVKRQKREQKQAAEAAAAWFSSSSSVAHHAAEDEAVGGIQLRVRPALSRSFRLRLRKPDDAGGVQVVSYAELLRSPAELQMDVGAMLELESALLPGRKLGLVDWIGPQKMLALESAHKVMLTIKTLTSTLIPIQAESTDTIEAIKIKIYDTKKIPTDQQRLIWNGKQLEDSCTLEEYGISSEAFIHLVLRLRGGCFTADTLVSTTGHDGLKQRTIAGMQVGDEVLVYHMLDRELQTRTVSRVHCFHVNEFATVRCSDGRTLCITPGHAVRLANKNSWAAVDPDAASHAWVSKLQVGDVLQTSHEGGGGPVSVVSIDLEYLETPLAVYTLSIAPNAKDEQRSVDRAPLEPSRVGNFELPYVNFFANGVLVHNGSNGIKLWVRVTLPSGETLIVHAESDDKVLSIRNKINEHLGPSARLYSLFYNDMELTDEYQTLDEARIVQGSTLRVLIGSGVAAGAQIQQQIYEDTQPVGSWTDDTDVCSVFVHLANADMWHQITGRAMPPTPVSARTYAQHGLPFYQLWNEQLKCVAKSDVLAGIPDLKHAILVSEPVRKVSSVMSEVLDEPELSVPDEQKVTLTPTDNMVDVAEHAQQ